jgi:3-phosphoshikimate 1-carboxyvinyltransferase
VTGPRVVEPLDRPPDATVRLPGSKSITNRALVVAGLAGGRSRLDGVLFADDTEAMLECLRRLGAGVEADPESASVVVDGLDGVLPPGPADLYAGQAGTTARFLLPVLATGPGPYRLDADPQLRARPMGPGIQAVRSLGATVDEVERRGHLPVVVRGGRGGRGGGGSVRVSGNVSSQFLSGLLLAGPLLAGGLEVEVTTSLVSRPYSAMTVGVMAGFGVAVDHPAPGRYVVPPAGYRPTDFRVEPDASTASYFLAAAVMTGGRVTVVGLREDSLQGDVGFVDVLTRMGATCEWGRDGVTVTAPSNGDLQGIEADLRDMSDTAPTLAALAVFASGATRVRGIGFTRRKETDRVRAVVRELRRCGIEATEDEDGFTVRPGPVRPAVVEPEGDHRIAMAFALLGLRVEGIAVAEPDCVAKSFPGYWDELDRLRRRD